MGAFSLAAVLFVVALGVLYQTAVAPLLRVGGVFRNVEPLNNQHCKVVPALEGCESEYHLSYLTHPFLLSTSLTNNNYRGYTP